MERNQRIEGQRKREVSQHHKGGLAALQKVLNSRKGSVSATYKKNIEVNTKAHDLNQKTVQVLNSLVGVYATFDEAWANLENENSEGGVRQDDEGWAAGRGGRQRMRVLRVGTCSHKEIILSVDDDVHRQSWI